MIQIPYVIITGKDMSIPAASMDVAAIKSSQNISDIFNSSDHGTLFFEKELSAVSKKLDCEV